MHLDPELFKTIVRVTPLVAIDLIVSRQDGKILLGKRNNRPAQGFWFVPGGRILKDETLDEAFLRLTRVELNRALLRTDYPLPGVYEHLYPDNFSDETFSTHYVVLGYRIQLDTLNDLPWEQHSDYRWLSRAEILADDGVHENTKAYFRDVLHGGSLQKGED